MNMSVIRGSAQHSSHVAMLVICSGTNDSLHDNVLSPNQLNILCWDIKMLIYASTEAYNMLLDEHKRT